MMPVLLMVALVATRQVLATRAERSPARTATAQPGGGRAAATWASAAWSPRRADASGRSAQAVACAGRASATCAVIKHSV